MTKAVNELGLEWSPLRSHLSSRLDECFLMGCCQRPPPTLVPLLSRSSYELTILWHAPPFVSHLSFCFSYSHIRWRHWRKRIRAPASSERVCGHTSMPAHSYRMEGEGESSVQAIQSRICTRWMRLLGGWTSGLQRFTWWLCSRSSVQDARHWGSRSGFSLSQGPEELDRPGSKCHQSHRPSHRAFNVQPYSVGAPPLAHDDRDERGGQSSFPRRSDLLRQPVWTSCGGLCWTLHRGSEVVSGDATLPP